MKLFSVLLLLTSFAYANQLQQNTFSLLVWNIQKASDKKWPSDFNQISKNKDIILIQEALMTEEAEAVISSLPFNSELAKTFSYFGNDTGVLTLSSYDWYHSFPLLTEDKEPITSTPKSSLVTFFNIAGQEVMVINTHGINFVGSKKFKNQIDAIESEILLHDGPIIWGGDLNTWSQERLDIVNQMVKKNNLREVNLPGQGMKKGPFPWAKMPLDHLYYRQLSLVNSQVLTEIDSSDHKPITAIFSL